MSEPRDPGAARGLDDLLRRLRAGASPSGLLALLAALVVTSSCRAAS
jgi:hypothetical protein